MASSLPAGNASCTSSSSTYIRSQYNLNPPPVRAMDSPHSPDPLPGYSEGPPSTIGDFNWGNTTASSIDGGSVMGSCTGCPTYPSQGPTYLSSAMSTSSADSGSVSGLGSNSGSGSAGGGSRRPSNFRSFNNQPPAGLSQPKAVFGKDHYNIRLDSDDNYSLYSSPATTSF